MNNPNHATRMIAVSVPLIVAEGNLEMVKRNVRLSKQVVGVRRGPNASGLW